MDRLNPKTEAGSDWTTLVEKEVKEAGRKLWEEIMLGKSALTIYRGRKKEVRKELWYDNSRWSALLRLEEEF